MQAGAYIHPAGQYRDTYFTPPSPALPPPLGSLANIVTCTSPLQALPSPPPWSPRLTLHVLHAFAALSAPYFTLPHTLAALWRALRARSFHSNAGICHFPASSPSHIMWCFPFPALLAFCPTLAALWRALRAWPPTSCWPATALVPLSWRSML
jgi:hypothetical protein